MLQIFRFARLSVVACLVCSAIAQDRARADTQDKLEIEIYLSLETDACGPGGYPPPTQCGVLSAEIFDAEIGRKFKLFRSGIVVPPSSVKWTQPQLSTIRRYQLLGRPELSRRWSALVVFRWNGRRPSYLILQRGGSPTGKPFEATVGQNKRTFYHLPLEYLNPAYRDSWMLKTNYATYQIRFSE